MAFEIERDEHGKPICLYSFPPYEWGPSVTAREKERAVRVAEEYRQSMLLVAIERGMNPQEATAFAQRCVYEQLLTKDQIEKRRDLGRLRKPELMK